VSDFAHFCSLNKIWLNKFIANYVKGEQEKYLTVGSEETLKTYLLHMPSILDFENKQALFRQELKKIKEK
jgi:hypothetical protein